MSEQNPRATAFTEAEEAFFRAGSTVSDPEPVETFTDLDEGYRPKKVWNRLFGRHASQH